jgi:hypothetical protein
MPAITVHEAQLTALAARIAAIALLVTAVEAAAAPGTGRPAGDRGHAVLVAGADFPRPSLEVSTSTLPRFDGLLGPARASRVDITLMPEQRSGLGLAMGMSSSRAFSVGAFPVSPASLATFDLGVHWRYTLDSNYRFDVTAYRRMPNTDAISLVESREPSYGARVEMGLASRYNERKGFVADRGFVGFQLESGARLTVKRSGGVPMLYYRNTF